MGTVRVVIEFQLIHFFSHTELYASGYLHLFLIQLTFLSNKYTGVGVSTC